MLKKVKPELTKNREIRIKDAAFPAPFANVLEFNSPAHGTWNIVHMGMLVPEARQIYVCAYNCMRGVVLTAADECTGSVLICHFGRRGYDIRKT